MYDWFIMVVQTPVTKCQEGHPVIFLSTIGTSPNWDNCGKKVGYGLNKTECVFKCADMQSEFFGGMRSVGWLGATGPFDVLNICSEVVTLWGQHFPFLGACLLTYCLLYTSDVADE